MIENENSHKLLRLYNKVFTIAFIFGVLALSFQSSTTGMLYLLIFLVVFMSSYTLASILLHPGVSSIFGRKIQIDKTNKFFYRISILANIVFLLIGCLIILFAFFKAQYAISFFGLLFLLLSYFNIKALTSKVKDLD